MISTLHSFILRAVITLIRKYLPALLYDKCFLRIHYSNMLPMAMLNIRAPSNIAEMRKPASLLAYEDYAHVRV